MLVVRPVVLALIRPKVEAGEMVEGPEGLPSAEEQLALYEALEEANRTDEEEIEAGDEDEELVFKDIEAITPTSSPFGQSHGAGCNPGSGLDETRCGKSINQKLSWLARKARMRLPLPI